MERKQNIRLAKIRTVAFNSDFQGNSIDQNDSAGVIRFSNSLDFYPCGHQKVGNIGVCSCVAF